MTAQKVVWMEGMFLTPQHFQQQERYLEHFAASLYRLGNESLWGFSALRLDPHLARQSKIGLTTASGILPDLTPFDMPHGHALPTPVEINTSARNTLVHLALPLHRHGIPEVGSDENTRMRYRSTAVDIVDNATAEGGEYRIDICSANFRLVSGNEDLPGYAYLPVARIIEVRDDKSLQLDENFIAPCIDINVSERLRGFIAELSGMLQYRAAALAAQTSDGNRPGTAEFIDYLMLLAVNRYAPVVAQQGSHNRWHPKDCHALLLQLAGELSTFSNRGRRPAPFPAYRHHALEETFAPLISSLRQSLSMLVEQAALALPFTLHNYGIRVAAIADRSLLDTAQFILAAKADLPAERIREKFIGVAKLAPVEQIRQLVNRQLPGIRLNPLPVTPRQIPWHAGFTYFDVERSSELWSALHSSGGFALHVGEGFPGLELEFWAIRE
jgi:type VI secretion system protein ImpJ